MGSGRPKLFVTQSIPLALMGEELSKSWNHHIRKSWILNVGDIKPQEAEMTTSFIKGG
ncbi:glycosyl hydrolase 115 family protein [Paenibacillus cellulositrophicus]|uniref:glycosyl hydrolase 115 family protein n=1 Tax=Paenibacillus cellulositrophicus TaxID=562959 RepID=UPI0012678193